MKLWRSWAEVWSSLKRTGLADIAQASYGFAVKPKLNSASLRRRFSRCTKALPLRPTLGNVRRWSGAVSDLDGFTEFATSRVGRRNTLTRRQPSHATLICHGSFCE